MDVQQDKWTNSKGVRMTAWKHLKLNSVLAVSLNFLQRIEIIFCLNATAQHEYEKKSSPLLRSSLFSFIWLAQYTEWMGVRVCSCCGNGLLFVKGYIPGIWCVCAAIDKKPSLQGLMNGPSLLPGQAAGSEREKEFGGRCANRKTVR